MNNQLELFFGVNEDKEIVPYKSYYNFDERGKVKVFDGEAGSTVLPKWNIATNVDLDGRATIRDHSDVAHMMRRLESKGVELAFAVHVNENKEPLVQLLSIGGKAGTVIDSSMVLAGAKVHDSKHIYLVHNHPSGNLTPSSQDMEITKKTVKALESLNISVNHVILNTYKKEYTLISDDSWESFPRDLNMKEDIKHTTHVFDEMNVLREPIKGPITGSKDAAELVQQYRFSALPKHGLLLLATNNSVIANFFVNDFSFKSVTDAIANIPAATSVIAYGNTDQSIRMNELRKTLPQVAYRMLDYIQVNSNANGIQGAYKSYVDEGVLRETQEKYGTNEIQGQRAVKLNQPWKTDDSEAGVQRKATGFSR